MLAMHRLSSRVTKRPLGEGRVHHRVGKATLKNKGQEQKRATGNWRRHAASPETGMDGSTERKSTNSSSSKLPRSLGGVAARAKLTCEAVNGGQPGGGVGKSDIATSQGFPLRLRAPGAGVWNLSV